MVKQSHSPNVGPACGGINVCEMSLDSLLDSIDAVARKLPFPVDNFAQANETYSRWRRSGSAEDRKAIDIWTYCFVCRYYATQFIRTAYLARSDFDELVESTFRKIKRKETTVRQPERFAGWVGSVCRNTYINYLRSVIPAGAAPDHLVAEGTPDDLYDAAEIRIAVADAISRLPRFLRQAAMLRFLDGLDYSEIAAVTGKPVPTLRSYIGKTVIRFRNDAALVRVLRERMS
jgi:RNA polymerase sigma factor (sigma-70 family)